MVNTRLKVGKLVDKYVNRLLRMDENWAQTTGAHGFIEEPAAGELGAIFGDNEIDNFEELLTRKGDYTSSFQFKNKNQVGYAADWIVAGTECVGNNELEGTLDFSRTRLALETLIDFVNKKTETDAEMVLPKMSVIDAWYKMGVTGDGIENLGAPEDIDLSADPLATERPALNLYNTELAAALTEEQAEALDEKSDEERAQPTRSELLINNFLSGQNGAGKIALRVLSQEAIESGDIYKPSGLAKRTVTGALNDLTGAVTGIYNNTIGRVPGAAGSVTAGTRALATRAGNGISSAGMSARNIASNYWKPALTSAVGLGAAVGLVYALSNVDCNGNGATDSGTTFPPPIAAGDVTDDTGADTGGEGVGPDPNDPITNYNTLVGAINSGDAKEFQRAICNYTSGSPRGLPTQSLYGESPARAFWLQHVESDLPGDITSTDDYKSNFKQFKGVAHEHDPKNFGQPAHKHVPGGVYTLSVGCSNE